MLSRRKSPPNSKSALWELLSNPTYLYLAPPLFDNLLPPCYQALVRYKSVIEDFTFRSRILEITLAPPTTSVRRRCTFTSSTTTQIQRRLPSTEQMAQRIKSKQIRIMRLAPLPVLGLSTFYKLRCLWCCTLNFMSSKQRIFTKKYNK